MDKGKTGAGRGSKSKTPQYPSDLIALGKSSSSSSDNKRSTTTSSSSSSSKSERKREGVVLPPSVPVKKAKVTTSSAGSSPRAVAGSGGVLEAWESLAIECDPADLVPSVLEAYDQDQADRYVGLLCGAIPLLRSQRWKPDNVVYVGLQYLCKVRPSLFSEHCVMLALCSLLRRDAQHNFKSKGNPAVLVLAASLLTEGYLHKKQWPEEFVKLYVEDALNERVWVDQPLCQGFVNNILTCVNTRVPPKSLMEPLTVGVMGRASPSVEETVDTTQDSGESLDILVKPRYLNQQEAVEQIVLSAIKEQLNRRQPPENITRNFLRLLSSTSGLVEVRVLVAPRLELWLQNPKLNRPAQDLLMALCVNCTTHGARDVEVITQVVKIRLKTKALVQLYLAGIRELIAANRGNLETIMRTTVYNELSSTARNANNMAMLAAMFQSAPDASATLLAEIFLDLLMNREDYLRPLRALLREIARVVRHDMAVRTFCQALSANRSDTLAFRDFEFKERMFASVIDLMVLGVFLMISPPVREAASLLARGDRRDVHLVQGFQTAAALVQCDTVRWLSDGAHRAYGAACEVVRALYKVALLEPVEQYVKTDNWPSEAERGLVMRMAMEVPIMQDTLRCVLNMGLSKERRLSVGDALELVDQLVKRAASLPRDGLPMLQVDDMVIVDLLFQLSAYHQPDTISLPDEYVAPAVAVSAHYWRVWLILVVLAAHNPLTCGVLGWRKYPTLRSFMEACIMNAVQPPTEDERATEMQVAAREKSTILEFESLLAASSSNKIITEQTSLLLSTLTLLDPKGPSRRPPQHVLDQLMALNATHHFGLMLSAVRQPDFLQEIMQQRGADTSKPWMSDLVNSSDAALSNLPLACLCECLLSTTDLAQSERPSKFEQLLQHLQMLVSDPGLDPRATCEVLGYVLSRLSSGQAGSRQQAIKGLKLILSAIPCPSEPAGAGNQPITDENRWLLRQLPQLPHFNSVRNQIVNALRLACQHENQVSLVASYLGFLATHTQGDGLVELTDLVQDLSQLIVERSTLAAALLPSDKLNASALATQHALMTMFAAYLRKARSPQREVYAWSESMDQILVTWPNRDETTMHILVVHALVILLNHGPGLDGDLFTELLEVFFPPPGVEPPKAYLVDTSEEALLLPDWLKLRMIRSNVDRLVDAALQDLDPSSLVLFIQSFGIPVPSMNKLLARLDSAVQTCEASVSEAVLDKTYMSQLVQVQRHRGAVGGDVLVRRLQLEQPRIPDSCRLSRHEGRPRLPQPASRAEQVSACTSATQCVQLLDVLFRDPSADEEAMKRASRALQRGLSLDRGRQLLPPVITDYLRGHLSRPLVTALLDHERYACPLLRLLASWPPAQQVFREMLVMMPQGARSPLVATLAQGTVARRRLEPPASMELCNARLLRESSLVSLERSGRRLIEQTHADTRKLADDMARLLVDDTDQSQRTGLLVDWLIEVDPELVGPAQLQLLFTQSERQSCRPHLLTLLTHRASWLTLHTVVDHLLTEMTESYDPTAVLDFLSALTCNPRLWQGREKKTPKHYVTEDILSLSEDQLNNLVLYIVNEAMQRPERLRTRLSLLTQCLVRPHSLRTVANQLHALVTQQAGVRSEVSHQLLIQLYLGHPGITFILPSFPQDDALVRATTEDGSTSIMDSTSHTLLTGLTATAQTKDWLRRGQEYELALRKMASVHPVLTLRQLPMLAAQLRGRTHLDWVVLRSRHHLSLFHQVLGLLQLLQPFVFRCEYSAALHEILSTYLNLVSYHMVQEKGLQMLKKVNGQKESYALLNQLIELIEDYIAFDAHTALKFLQAWGQLLHDVQRLHPSVSSIRQLLAGVSLPTATDDMDQVAAQPIVTGAGLAAGANEPAPQQLHAMMTTLSKLQGDDVLTTLQELDQLSLRKAGVLEAFTERVCELLLSPVKELRTLAHSLLARFLRHEPATCLTGVTGFFRCLESDQPEVIASALDRLPEMVLIAQEHGLSLMQKVFRLGVTSKINVLPAISRTNALLNIQKGC